MKPVQKPQSGRWADQFNKLAEFRADTGHCNVASSCTWDPELGKWICNQRERYRKGLLSNKRLQRLKDLGFQFDHHNDRWESRYCELIQFKEEHGHCNVPDSWPENLRLARWVMTQRQMYRKGKLSRDRIQRLETIGFIWCRQEHGWNQMYQRLVSFLKAHGVGAVPLELKGDPQLGSWVVKQRHRKRNGLLSKERVRKLDEAVMRW
jgi:hypothetical protein